MVGIFPSNKFYDEKKRDPTSHDKREGPKTGASYEEHTSIRRNIPFDPCSKHLSKK